MLTLQWIFLLVLCGHHPTVVSGLSRLITSKAFFSNCQLPESKTNNIEQLKQNIPLRKVIASFDISKNVSFFKLESCQSYVLCFVTKFDVIKREDFGKSNFEIWAKLVDAFEGKGLLEPFKEEVHRKQYGRSSLEDSCIDGYFVIRHVAYNSLKRKRLAHGKKNQTDHNEEVSRSRSRKAARRVSKKAIKEAKRRKRHRKKLRKQNRNIRNGKTKSTVNTDCEDDDAACIRTCVGWGNGLQQCVKLRVSCTFHCPARNNWELNNLH